MEPLKKMVSDTVFFSQVAAINVRFKKSGKIRTTRKCRPREKQDIIAQLKKKLQEDKCMYDINFEYLVIYDAKGIALAQDINLYNN
jgi:hypothetical protein